jgi:hypothetical protein
MKAIAPKEKVNTACAQAVNDINVREGDVEVLKCQLRHLGHHLFNKRIISVEDGHWDDKFGMSFMLTLYQT